MKNFKFAKNRNSYHLMLILETNFTSIPRKPKLNL
jgi:hypothetical protein